MTKELLSPLLTKRRHWLLDIGRSDMWYRDNAGNSRHDPPLPKTIKQGRENFILTAEGEAYKRALLRKAGIKTVGRPRKQPKSDDQGVAEHPEN